MENWMIMEREVVELKTGAEFYTIGKHEFCGSVEDVKKHLLSLVYDWSMLEIMDKEKSSTSVDDLLVAKDGSITAAFIFGIDTLSSLAITAYPK